MKESLSPTKTKLGSLLMAFSLLLLFSNACAVNNLPESFSERPGLEGMPKLDYAQMPVVNVKELGALGDGKQIAIPFFDKALDQLKAQGGGILFIPKGHYIFQHDPKDDRYWRMDYGQKKLGSIWPGKKYSGLKNIHFVGEGIESILEFRFLGPAKQYAVHVNGFTLFDTKNVSLHNLALTQSPFFRQRRGGDLKFGNTFRVEKAVDMQVTKVFVDQGELGMGFFHSKNIWIVDCDFRNTRADEIKVDNCDEVTVAYNRFEEPMDDNISMIYYTRHRPTPSKGYRCLYNTILGPAFGRGYIMCGEDIVVKGNWIERCYGNGIATYGLLADTQVVDNTLIRCGLAARDGNPRPAQGEPSYSSSLKIGGRNLVVKGNRIYGAQGEGMFLRSMNGAVVADNVIEDGSDLGLHFGKTKAGEPFSFKNSVFENNRIVNNKVDLVVNGKFENVQIKENILSQPATIGTVTGELDMGKVKVLEGKAAGATYEDYYAFARKATADTRNQPMVETDLLQGMDAAVVNIRDHGAQGDGTTNDTAALQKAIAALPETGGTVKIPKGTYLLAPMAEYETTPFTMIRQHIRILKRQKIRILGDGPESILSFSSLEHQGLRFIGCQQVAVQNLMVTTNKSLPLRRNRAFLDFSGCQNVLVSDVFAKSGNGPAIQLDTTNRAIIRDCTISDAGQYGIRIEASCQVEVASNQITNTRDNAIHIGYSGSILRDSDYVRVEKNRIDGTKEGAGICVISGKVELIENDVKNTALSGVYVYQPAMGWAMNELTILRNTFENCGTYEAHSGILFSTPCRRGDRGRVRIEDNSFKDLPHNAVHVTFGRQMIWGAQGFYSFIVTNNHYEGVTGKKVWIDKQCRKDGRDGDIRIGHLEIDRP